MEDGVGSTGGRSLHTPSSLLRTLPMDKQALEDALRELDTCLATRCDVVLVGGAAMILHFGASRATRDVDILLLRGDKAEFRQAAKEIARRRGLPEDWITDAVKGFFDILPPDFYNRLVPWGQGWQHLQPYVLGRPDQVAMKIVALRERDLEDLDILLPPLSEEERGIVIAIMQRVGTIRPDWAQKMYYFLLERGWKID